MECEAEAERNAERDSDGARVWHEKPDFDEYNLAGDHVVETTSLARYFWVALDPSHVPQEGYRSFQKYVELLDKMEFADADVDDERYGLKVGHTPQHRLRQQ